MCRARLGYAMMKELMLSLVWPASSVAGLFDLEDKILLSLHLLWIGDKRMSIELWKVM